MQGPCTRPGRGERPPSGHASCSLRAVQQTPHHWHSALGTGSTQGDRGVNDSVRHLDPSGDSGGRESTTMTCTRSRSTEKRERERNKMERGTDPRAERNTEPAVRSKPVLSHRRWEGPSPDPGHLFPAPSHPEMTLSPVGCAYKSPLAGTFKKHRGILCSLFTEDSVAEPTPEGG